MSAEKSPLEGKVVMAVDDEPDVLETLADTLDMCEVVKKTSFNTAMDYLQDNRPDLVILDIMGVNGFELLKYCVEKDLPAVMLTAHAFSVESLRKSIAMGAKAYLPKEKISEIVPFLEDVVSMRHQETWQRLFDRLSEFLNAAFGRDWHRDVIEVGPFIVPEK